MSVRLNQVRAQLEDVGGALPPVMSDFDRQSLRILRCAARTMASNPGGLRFKAGSQPWLGELSAGPLALIAAVPGRGGSPCSTPVGH